MKETMKSKGTIIMTKELLDKGIVIIDRENGIYWNYDIEKQLKPSTIYFNGDYNGLHSFREIFAIELKENIKLVEVEDTVEKDVILFEQEKENGIVTIKYHKDTIIREVPKSFASQSYQSARSMKHYLGK